MESNLLHYATAILAGLASGIVSEIGGAGSLISLPMLIGLGLPPNVANGTNRIGVMTQYTMGYIRYRTQKSVPHKEAAILPGYDSGSLLCRPDRQCNLQLDLYRRHDPDRFIHLLFP